MIFSMALVLAHNLIHIKCVELPRPLGRKRCAPARMDERADLRYFCAWKK